MQAETRTLTQLFQLDVRYVIPLYQRPYVWTEERQWAPLWDDIATVANHVMFEGATAKSPVHFLGAIVIQQEENPPGSPQRFLVIDGQQRLTTLQLLLAAAARAAELSGCPDEGKLLRRLTANDPLLAKGDERFKVWPTNANRAAFITVMEPDGASDAALDDPNNEIQEAYAFFCQQIQSWATDDDGDGAKSSPDKQFAALRVSLSDLLKLVSIRLEDGDSPQVIFETLNGRGTPLIALDLLKNAVFLEAAREQVDTDHLYHAHWAPELDRDYWREDRRAGRLFTKNGDMFLQYWLVAELAEPVPSTELFDIFRKRILQPATCPPMAELIPTLARDAATLRQFQSAEAGSPDRRFVELLELLDTTTLMPIALLLLRSDQISAERRAHAFAILESFLVRRMLCGWTTKNYNRLAAALVGEIKKDIAHADTVLQSRLAAETAPANRWPRDDDLHAALRNKDMYGQRRQDRLVMVLWRIEEHLRIADNKVEQGLAAPSKLTLEHLIPQAWESHWPLDGNQSDPAAWRSAHLHRLGNLTLTTGPLNSSLSNLPWHAPEEPKDKRRSLVQHSLLKLNTTVVHDYPEHFDEHSVDERGAWLTSRITQIWPGPPVHRESDVENASHGADAAAASQIAASHRAEPQSATIRETNHQHSYPRQVAPAARVVDDLSSAAPGSDAQTIGDVDKADLADFQEERFGQPLSFTTLSRAGDDEQRERRLTTLLRKATGIGAVRPMARPEIGAWVMLDAAIGTKSTQRLCLQQHGDNLILRTWLAELKPQAEALYRTGRAEKLLKFLSERRTVWFARPNLHLAFRSAAALRLYPHCRLEAGEYVQRWSGEDFGRIGAHPREELRSSLWPWLRNRQYAEPEDDEQLDAFMNRLGRRDVHLRPSLEVTRIWPWEYAVDLDERGELTRDLRIAVAELLSALSEPLPPACVVTSEDS
ncbi:DUF262 domain-containing protein [Mycobacterium sp. E2733]|uniref:DUF262 domain-containing protein n=1 Tax=Mycobacterium sp. E2733 TaxID=1834138 RepID=UPI0007FE8E42|nr:DUF262 domain-containing protein [Mycobacterium sp. E2733]OBH94303.1 hypothetical protein A5678_04560 [Mycobacterium sp. E2733]